MPVNKYNIYITCFLNYYILDIIYKNANFYKNSYWKNYYS